MADDEDAASRAAEAGLDLIQDEVDAALDALGDVHPAFKLAAPLIKLMISPAFEREEKDPNAMILEKLGELEKGMKRLEDNMKDHMQNVVTLADLGGAPKRG